MSRGPFTNCGPVDFLPAISAMSLAASMNHQQVNTNTSSGAPPTVTQSSVASGSRTYSRVLLNGTLYGENNTQSALLPYAAGKFIITSGTNCYAPNNIFINGDDAGANPLNENYAGSAGGCTGTSETDTLYAGYSTEVLYNTVNTTNQTPMGWSGGWQYSAGGILQFRFLPYLGPGPITPWSGAAGWPYSDWIDVNDLVGAHEVTYSGTHETTGSSGGGTQTTTWTWNDSFTLTFS